MRTYYPGGSNTVARVRENVLLSGLYNSINRTFFLPEPAKHDPPRSQIKLYHGGRRLHPIEYQVFESVPGNGYDGVLLIFAPHNTSKLYADYIVA